MACLNHTAAADSEALCSSLSQMFTPAPRLQDDWFPNPAAGLERSQRFGEPTHIMKRADLYTSLERSVLQIFKSDLWFRFLRWVRPCAVPARRPRPALPERARNESRRSCQSQTQPLCHNPSLYKSNRTAIFETTSGNSCRCWGSDAWNGRGASFTSLLWARSWELF